MDYEAQITEALQALQAKKLEWAKLPLTRKADLLDAVRRRLLDKMEEAGRASAEVKGNGDDPELVAGEMLAGTGTPATYMYRMANTLRQLAATGKAQQLPVRTAANGQKVVKTFPLSWADRNSLLQPGSVNELYLLPGEETVRQAELYGADGTVKHEGRVCAVLGAGNQGFLALKDALVVLYERGEVAAVKPHPIQDAWHRFADYVMAPLIEAGYVRSLYLPSPAETRTLLYHPLVDCVHMTGGTATHDAIVWGSSPEEQARRRAANDPLLKVPITSELGCVTPFIVAPAEFTDLQIKEQAANLVLAVTSNTGCNCNSAKVLVLPGDWAQADAFLERVRSIMRHTPLDPPYYPGIHQRYAAFKERYPGCEEVMAPAKACSRPLGEPLPYLINVLDKVPEDMSQEYAFQVEPFAPVLTVVRLPTSGPEAFLDAATRFANESLWGTLSCMLVVHPDLEKSCGAAVEKAIDSLRYGLVSVNCWSAVSFITGTSTWGAFEGGQTVADVGSGIGLMGNPFLVEGLQKAVYRVPITGQAVPKPMHMQPLPMSVARLALGFLVDGWWGLMRAAWGVGAAPKAPASGKRGGAAGKAEGVSGSKVEGGERGAEGVQVAA
ncbi:hypothetical protein HYH03_016961 [Edaphochlamys debaryana]|uniref:Aldehyde dehydrogenase domain-containing protein n=1 Tax=Edaphochlamys debaryana TaxID=47281 RepID=A0A836BPD6_9CHLO|nr:hypothetical protein HYH03_016961 [Edaphochlamys debaryana]|eukprot:KAG2484226.1 hypothetical protein HYH03_016961 [Edaphochlamys debaryana]